MQTSSRRSLVQRWKEKSHLSRNGANWHKVRLIASTTCTLEVDIKGKQRPSHYVELGSEDGKLVNAWITDIIKDELSKYILNSGDVYIMPLGKVKSQKTGYEYHDFVILQDKDVSEEQ